jgi:hypothetical protein
MRSTTQGTISTWAVITVSVASEATADRLVEIERAAGNPAASAADDDRLRRRGYRGCDDGWCPARCRDRR